MTFYNKLRRQKFLSFSLVLFTLALGVLIGTVIQTGTKAATVGMAAPDATPLTIPSPVQMQNEFSKIAKRLEPSVVNISTEYIPKKETAAATPAPRGGARRRAVPQDDEEGQDDNMQQFFQRFFGNGGGSGGATPFTEPDGPSQALGSGVVVDHNGYILTNNHVVEKATRIKVKFTNDPTDYPATVIGTDKDTDLAVIRVDKKNLIPAKIGNSDALQVGDWTVAIGSPFGFQATVTAGIVSALSRDVPGRESNQVFQHFIQTDAAINPGNSGGPLLNINGELIGINTMIASRSGGFQGIGFAMPINTAVKVYNGIIREGHMTRGSIGIGLGEANESLLRVYGATHGVVVHNVTSDSPAEKGGLKEGDFITAINGKNINKGQDLIDIVADSPIGSALKIAVMRDAKPMTLSVVVGDRTKVFPELYGGVKAAPVEAHDDKTTVRFGMAVESIRPAVRQQSGYKGAGGVMVSSVEVGSFADEIGLQKGDIVTEMNRQPVNSPEDIRRIQGALKPHNDVAFRVMRQAGQGSGAGWVPFFAAGPVPADN